MEDAAHKIHLSALGVHELDPVSFYRAHVFMTTYTHPFCIHFFTIPNRFGLFFSWFSALPPDAPTILRSFRASRFCCRVDDVNPAFESLTIVAPHHNLL